MTENIKCLVNGDGTVGKTCLLISYANNEFPTDYVPTVFDNYNATVLFENKHVSLGLWDLAYGENPDMLRKMSYPDTDVFIMCYSIVDRKSFENIKEKWYPEIQKYCPGAPILLSANKVDLRDDVEYLRDHNERNGKPIVTTEEMNKLVQELKYVKGGFETSARELHNIKELFLEAIRCILAPETIDFQGGNKTCHIL